MRPNLPSENFEEYFRRSVFIPYLDSIIASLVSRFSDCNNHIYSLLQLHPTQLVSLNKNYFENLVNTFQEVYHIDHFEDESSIGTRKHHQGDMKDDVSLVDLLEEAYLYPAINITMQITLSLPATKCTIERSFSTMRRVKTWLRSTMSNSRLSGLLC
ncbi:hypothetical protein PR048_006665 [Dryococelus australis]|uniref:HAT C-terminal dimerisation domain-containing protein n=1 Tax=Dryococelus australis TaxID=614101 RepID=A0ABQ9ICW9_9NEOP|nr:hypothetical protein PR048_006665 [Dryococelus australis]